MKFKLAAKGTVTECREALNGAIAKLAGPHKQEFAVIRAIAHYIVEENLDPLYAPWVDATNALRAGGAQAKAFPPEPMTSFSIDCTVTVEEVARSGK